jgi:hypothetical protein
LKLKKTICIDGDWLIYSIACTAEELYIEAALKTDPTNIIEYSGITQLKNEIGADFKTVRQFYEIKDCKRLKEDFCESLTKCQFSVNARLKKILKLTSSTDYVIALGGPTNFRTEISLPVKYKASRDDVQRPLLLSALREWLLATKNCVVSDNEEADDIVSKYQYLGSLKHPDGSQYLASTVDKDSRGTAGKVYHPLTETILDISGLGFLRLDVKISAANKKTYSVYGEGRKWLYYQIVMGDPVDDYNPLDLLKKCAGRSNLSGSPSISPLRFFNLFKDCATDKECWSVIVTLYKLWYGDLQWWLDWRDQRVEGTWVDLLQMYVDVAFMRRWDNDRLDVITLLKKYNLLDI